jgi:hypothetical protein
MSPIAMTSGCVGRVRSGSTVTRPARSSFAPEPFASVAARGETVTPAAEITVRVGIPSMSPSGRRTCAQSGVNPDPLYPVRTLTPNCSGDAAARLDSDGGNEGNTRSAASTMSTRPALGSTARKSPGKVSRASSAIWPAISTPVLPAPTTRNVSQLVR